MSSRIFVSNNQQATARMLFFPFAGGSGEYYLPWFKSLPSWLDCIHAQLPGRGQHFFEPAIDNLDKLCQLILPELLQLTDKPLYLFGHSMGALIAYNLACKLQERNIKLARLYISGHRAISLPYDRASIHLMTDADMLQQTVAMGGDLANADLELLAEFLPTLRSDFKLCETYQYKRSTKLSSPISVLYANDDPFILAENIFLWENETTAECTLHQFSGGHFYINSAKADIFALINQELNLYQPEIIRNNQHAYI